MKAGPVYKAVFGVAGVLLISRLLGFAREMVVADRFGTSAEYDLYLIAIMFSALAYGILNYAGYYLFVPYLTRKLQKSGSEKTDLWPLVNLSVLGSLLIVVGIELVAPYLLKIWAGEFSGMDYHLIVFYSRVTAVIALLAVGEALIRAFLNVKKIYTYPAAGYITFNLFSIASIVFLSDRYGVGAIAIGWIGGLLAQDLYLALRLIGMHPLGRFKAKLFDHDSKYLIQTAGILIVIELINRTYFLIDRYLAPQFGEGIVSALNYSSILVQLPDSIVGFAIGAVMFPYFSASASEQNSTGFSVLYRKTVLAALLIAIPIATFIFVNARELVFLLFERGVFNPRSTELTATVLRPHVPTMAALFIVSTSIRACYSGGWARTVFWITVLMFGTKFASSALLAHWVGYAGISAGTSVSQVGFALLLLTTVVVRTKAPGAKAFISSLVRVVCSGVVVGLILWYGEPLLPAVLQRMDMLSVFAKLVVSGVAMLGLFVVLFYALGIQHHLHDLLLSRIGSAEGTRENER